MSKKDDGFGEFMAFNFLTKGGVCIMPVISVVGVTVLLLVIL